MSKLKKYEDMIVGAVIAVVAAVYYAQTFNIMRVDMGTLDSAAVPRIYAALLFALGLLLILEGYVKSKRYVEPEKPSSEQAQVKKGKTRAILLAMIVLGISIALLNVTGFILSMILYLFVSFCLNSPKEKRNYILFAVIAVVSTLVIYFVFTKGFKLLLPMGIFR